MLPAGGVGRAGPWAHERGACVVWVAVLSAVVGYAQTDGQRIAALALVALTAGAPAIRAGPLLSVVTG